MVGMGLRVRRWVFVLLVSVLMGSCAMSDGEAAMGERPTALKVLFIGNSYTDGIQRVLAEMVAGSLHGESQLRFVWGGGATLQGLIDNGRAQKWIDRGPWDVVVLQEQSQLPALVGRPRRMFDEAVGTLVQKIRDGGAEPVLYMTWGRRDGDAENMGLLGDFATMQRRLSEAYRAAGERHGVRVAAVGEAWAEVRGKDAALGERLYQEDGAHPSAEGACVAACVFLRVLFGDTLEGARAPKGVAAEDFAVIREVVAGMAGIE
jgi:hypothetical protein